jgi:hypothetical protein
MPSPETCRQIEGPKNIEGKDCPGVYQIRNKKTQEFIQFGESKNLIKRMKSFFPKPYGTGTRNNVEKRKYILENWKVLQYRTISTDTKEEAVKIDHFLKSLNIHRYNT